MSSCMDSPQWSTAVIPIASHTRKFNRMKRSPLSQKWYRTQQKHISSSQKRAIQLHWGSFGLDIKYNSSVDFTEIFNLQAPFPRYAAIDIGFGTGDSLEHMANKNKNRYYVGCEIYRAGIASALQKLVLGNLSNARIIRMDATNLFERNISPSTLDEICVYFPDPWPDNARDGQRRVIRPEMLRLFEKCLKPNGRVYIATDVIDYAEHIETTFHASSNGSSCDDNDGGSADPDASTLTWTQLYKSQHPAGLGDPPWRGVTKYDRIAQEEGRPVWDYIYQVKKKSNENKMQSSR